MSTISPSFINNTKIVKREAIQRNSLREQYLTYAERQHPLNVYWFMKVILVIPCVYMVISIMAMALITSTYIWFVAVSMLLFFANVLAHIAQTKSTFYVPLYHASLALFYLLPLLTYLIHLGI